MALPGYAAEASLYRTSRSYRGASGGPADDSGLAVTAQQIACDDLCAIKWQVCNIGCAISGGILLPFCLAGCGVAFGLCLDDCPSGGGGGGGGGGTSGCCPAGRRCCGSCASGKCDDACIGPGQSCP
jgi:hypothetical protein